MLQRDIKKLYANPSHTSMHCVYHPGLNSKPRGCYSPMQRAHFLTFYEQSMHILMGQAQQGTTLHHAQCL